MKKNFCNRRDAAKSLEKMTVYSVGNFLDLVRVFKAGSFFGVYSLFYSLIQVLNYLINRFSYGNYTAQFGHILFRKKLFLFEDPTPRDFISLFLSRVEPEYVLKPNVSLYCVTKDVAVFVETPTDINVYSSDEHPFLYMAQFTRSVNVISMSVKTFHKLAEKVGDPLVPVIWLTSTGRCGSTILCQMFETIPGTLALAEPDAPQNIIYMKKRNKISQTEYEDLLKSSIRLLCKPHPGVGRICIKPTPIAVGMMSEMTKLFPNIKHIFMYRNCQATISSWLALMSSVPFTRVLRVVADNEGISATVTYFRKKLHYYFICNFKDISEVPMKNTNTVGILTHMWARYMLIARDAVSHDRTILPIRYERMLSAPVETSRIIFEKVGMDGKHVEMAVTALSKDAHRGSVVSQSRIGRDPWRQITEADRIKADAILSMYSLPYIGEDFTL